MQGMYKVEKRSQVFPTVKYCADKVPERGSNEKVCSAVISVLEERRNDIYLLSCTPKNVF